MTAATRPHAHVIGSDAEAHVFVYLPREHPGVQVGQDWTAFGQRATISGVTYPCAAAASWLSTHARSRASGAAPTSRSSSRPWCSSSRSGMPWTS
ncbi:MAG: hypothetical protein JWQ48_2672 [Conexibacter sp.]|jgi:alkylation response protein AidB-like acyl-CoA dehydrogenase|nr:hypothetical protein [Conexibacter sp.]